MLSLLFAIMFHVLRRGLARSLLRPGIDMDTVILHQDNAPPQRVEVTQLELGVMGFQQLVHSPYSSDLAHMDIEVFPQLKKHLRGIRHADTNELITHVRQIVKQFKTEFYQTVYSKWVKRHQKCINTQGQYFEKNVNNCKSKFVS